MPHSVRRLSLLVLLACAVCLCQCIGDNDASPWEHRLGQDADIETDGGSCERLWSPPTEFEEDADCESDEFRFVDRVCGPPSRVDGGSRNCSRRGNGRCYQRCETDADCTNPDRPHCSVLGLFASGDYSCNNSVKICRSTCLNECPVQ